MGIRAAIQSTVITSTEQRAHMQVSSSDHCHFERTILSTVSILAKGQINEECLLRHFESWNCWSFPDSWNPLSRRFLVASAAVWLLPQIQSLPGITLPHPVRFENEPSIKQLLPCWKNKKLPSFNVLPVLPIAWVIHAAIQFTSITSTKQRAHMHVSSSDHRERTIRNVQCWELKSWSFPDTWNPVSRRFLVTDAAAWQASAKPIDGHQGSWFRHVVFTCFLPCYHVLVQCGNELPIHARTRFPFGFLRSVQQWQWQSSSLMWRTHSPKQFWQRASCFICEYGKADKFSPSESSSHLYIQQICSTLYRIQGIYQCRCQPVTTVRLWDDQRSEQQWDKECLFAMLMTEKAWAWQTPQTLCQEDSRVLMLPCDDLLWLRFRFAARMSTARCSARISQQKY